MSDRTTPPPAPPRKTVSRKTHKEQVPIVDRRADFARKSPQTPDDEARTRAFIAGKIAMVRSDRSLSEKEKAAAIVDLERRLHK